MNPQNNDADKLEFLKKLPWETCVISADQKRQFEDFLVEYHDVFAKHHFDTEFKIKLMPEHPIQVYIQGPPAPIHLRDEILIEFVLLQTFNIITLLSDSKHSNPIFVHRIPSCKLRVLIDLSRPDHLLRHDYIK